MKRSLFMLVFLVLCTSGSMAAEPWFGRVLITNDDGIDNPRLIVLAQAFAKALLTQTQRNLANNGIVLSQLHRMHGPWPSNRCHQRQSAFHEGLW